MDQTVEYIPRPGFHITKEQAARYGKALAELRDELGHKATTQETLDAARPEDSPLHDYFDWDNESAAESYRMEQARVLSRSIFVRVVVQEQVVEMRQAFSVKVARKDGSVIRGYVGAQRVLATPELRKQVLQDALQRAKRWREDYKTYKELGPIFEAIDRVEREIEA